MQIPEYVVDKESRQNIETEVVLYAKDIHESCLVLCDPRERVSRIGDDDLVTFRIANRWCIVTDMYQRDEEQSNGTDDVVFIGVYAGGEQFVRKSGSFDGWLVKRASLPSGHVEYTYPLSNDVD
jgi:hypothetical protein